MSARQTRRPPVAIESRPADVSLVKEQIRQRDDTIDMLNESIADLQRHLMDEPGWQRMSAQFEQEFTAEGLRSIRAVCRVMSVAHPLIKRGLGLRAAYVWAQGAEITARSNGKGRGKQDVQAVVEAFLSDGGNQRAFTGAAARERLERCLGTDGEFFPALFTLPGTGEVQVRIVGADEIAEIICNPQDRSEPWYYRRLWVQRVLNSDGATIDQQMEQFHPAVDYRPKARPKTFGRIPVAWDAPMLHVKVNDLEGWQRGIPDAYAAIEWARAYKEFLEDWAKLVKSLSRFAWRMTAKGSGRQQARTRLAAAPPRNADGTPNDVGAAVILPPEQSFEAIPKSGATIDSESGKPLAAMIAAAMDVPLTMLLADPGQTGARAVAETLDQPTELAMSQRRGVWAAAIQRILLYAVTESVKGPDGLLKGSVVVDRYGRESLKLNGNTDPTVEITFPDLDSDPTAIIGSVVNAASTGTLPPDQVARMLLTALGVRNVDTLIEAMTDDDGNFVWPDGPPLGGKAPTGPPSMAPDVNFDDEPDNPDDVPAESD